MEIITIRYIGIDNEYYNKNTIIELIPRWKWFKLSWKLFKFAYKFKYTLKDDVTGETIKTFISNRTLNYADLYLNFSTAILSHGLSNITNRWNDEKRIGRKNKINQGDV